MQQQQQQQKQQKHINKFTTDLPTEVWAHVLHMLDVRDLARLHSAGGSSIIPKDDALFVWRAGRILSESELAWFARTRVRVALFDEVRQVSSPLFPNTTEYRRNGKLYRDNDLPAVVWINNNDTSMCWYQDGERHRDNDLPAVIIPNFYKEYFWRGKVHRPSGGPAIEYASGHRFWYWHGVRVGSSRTPDEEPRWFTPSGRPSKKGAPKWAKWGTGGGGRAAKVEEESR